MSVPVQSGPSHTSGGPAPSPHPARAYPRRTDQPRTYITARERAALVLAANGNTNRAIARRLGIGEETVKTRMQSILRKLRASDRAQAVAISLRIGLVSLDDVEIPAGANRGYRSAPDEGAA